ncbi:MAG: serine/threonine-protein kinase [Labilithrix sp.]
MSPVGSQVDRYELVGELATGGMATVYLGKQRGPFGFTRTVAIKSMHPQFAKDPDFRAMFLDEATLTARIRHPNVVPTLDIVAAESNVLIVMEYVEGVALSTLLRRSLTLSVKLAPAIASAIVCDLLHGLHAAHTLTDDEGQPLQVVHRDVSPQNVHVGADGLSRVLDFGVAKAASRRHVTQGGEVKGKLAYMSAEQVTGEDVDHRTDVYAAGVVLWETLTQKRLIAGAHDGEMLRKVLEPDFQPPSVAAPLANIGPALDAVVMKALSAKKEERYASADEMARALAAAQPPAPRDVIAAMVRDLCATELESRAQRLRTSIRPPEVTAPLPPELKMLAEVLTEHATVTRASVSSKTLPPSAAPPRARLPIGLVIGGGVLVSAAIIGAFVVGTRLQRPNAPTAPTVAALPPVSAPPPPAATESAAPPASASASPVVSASAAASSAQRPTKPPPKPIVTAKKPDCRVKYTVDANGDRHYKPECVD